MSGQLQKYHFTSPSGAETILKLNASDAERQGLTDADLVDEPEHAAESAPAPEKKARPASANKARSTSQNKGRTGSGDGKQASEGNGGGD